MGLFGFFRKRPADQAVVFAGDRLEAELVMGILQQEGFHPREWADLPVPSYAGPIGTARIVVPVLEGEAARSFLSELEGSARDDAHGGEENGDGGE
ncbi:MAG: hypothetical protein AB1384_07960 [Actinomycetota bacterium]